MVVRTPTARHLSPVYRRFSCLCDRFAAVAFIAAGVWDLSTLRADTGEMLEPSDYTPGIQTIADGLVMLGLAQALRLLLVLVTNTAKPF